MIKIFLDTNVLLDYIENRDREISSFISEIFRDEKIKIVTSSYNFIEILDKLQEIRFIGKLLNKRLSFDEVLKKRTHKELSILERREIQKEVVDFLKTNNIEILSLENKEFNLPVDLISNNNIDSQDSLIVATYLTSDADIFLTNDSNLIKALGSKVENLLHLKNNLKDLRKHILRM